MNGVNNPEGPASDAGETKEKGAEDAPAGVLFDTRDDLDVSFTADMPEPPLQRGVEVPETRRDPYSDPMYLKEFKLPCGIKVLYSRVQGLRFDVRLLLNVGHRHDPQGKEGLSHVLMHHLSAGSEGLEYGSAAELKKWTDAHRLKVMLGKIGDYGTEFSGFCHDENKGMLLDCMHKFVFKPKLPVDLEPAREIIRELRVEQGITEYTEKMRASLLFSHCGVHRMLTATGIPLDDSALYAGDLESVQAQHRRFYHYNNAVLMIAGNMEEPELLRVLDKVFPDSASEAPETLELKRVKPGKPVPKSGYYELGVGKKSKNQEFIFSWVTSKERAVESSLVRTFLERRLLQILKEKLQSDCQVSVTAKNGPEFDLFSVRGVVEQDKAATYKSAVLAALRDKAGIANMFMAERDDIAFDMSMENSTPADRLERAAQELSADRTILTLEERVNRLRAIMEKNIHAFLAEDLKESNFYLATVEQSE